MTKWITDDPAAQEEFDNIPEIDPTVDAEVLAMICDDLCKNFGDMRREQEEERQRKLKKKE